LTAAIFPRSALGRWGIIAYSLGLSLTLGALAGFALDVFPAGLRSGPWAALLVAVTLLAGGLALARRRKMAENGPSVVWLRLNIGLRQGALLALAGLLALAAIRLAVVGAIQQPRPGFTQFWMLPNDDTGGLAEDPGAKTLRVGLRSLELATEQYILEIKLNGQRLQALSGSLAPGQRFEILIHLPPLPAEGDERASASQRAKVEAVLYRLAEPDQPYRHLVWWP